MIAYNGNAIKERLKIKRFLIAFIRLFRRSNNNVPEFNRTMIPLQQDRAGFSFSTVHGPAGNSGNDLVADNGFSVSHHGNAPSDQGNVVALPLTRSFCDILIGRQKAIDPAEINRSRFLPLAVDDLQFIPPSQIYAAVTFSRVSEFNMQFKILEFLVGD